MAIGEEFESLLKLLTNSIVVHADETNWCIGAHPHAPLHFS